MKSLMSLEKVDIKLILILLVGFLFRILLINIKPPHFDEGVNGWFVDQIFLNGFFKYDPTNYHGPLHFYILAFFKLFLGRSLLMLRLSSILFGVGVVYLSTKIIKEDKKAYHLSALLLALSPGMIFFSRYGIHEMGFLFFSLLTIYSYINKKNNLLVFGFLGMLLMKETWIIFIFCLFLAVYFSKIIYPIKPKFLPTLCAVILFILFYSGFFKNPQGVIDFFKTFTHWFQTGVRGNGHEKEFLYWLKLFYRYEPFAVVGILGCIKYLFLKNSKLKFISVFGLAQFFIYSLIPYKTPWCAVQLLWPFYIMAVVLFLDFFKNKSLLLKTAMITSFVILIGSTMSRAISLNYIHYTNEEEPYVYVQTFNDIKNVMAKILKMPKDSLTIAIALESNWPLPWLLGDYSKTTYYEPQSELKAKEDVVFCDASLCEELKNTAFKDYFAQKIKLRASMEEVIVYFSKKKFKNN